MFRHGGLGNFNGSGFGRYDGGLSTDSGMGGGMSQSMGEEAAEDLNFRQRHDLTKAMLESISAGTSRSSRRRVITAMPGTRHLEGPDPIVARGIALSDPMKMMDLRRGARGLLNAIEMDPRAFVRRLQRVYGIGNIRIVQALARECREILGMDISGGGHVDDMTAERIGNHTAGLGVLESFMMALLSVSWKKIPVGDGRAVRVREGLEDMVLLNVSDVAENSGEPSATDLQDEKRHVVAARAGAIDVDS